MVFIALASTSTIADDAGFRAWGSALSAAFQALGLTLRGDAGTINWATVTKPSLTSAVAGFEVYAFADALQATAPIVVKVEYGTGNTATSKSLWITVGTGTDGAGNVAPMALIARTQLFSSGTSAIVSPTYVAGDVHWLAFVVDANTSNASGFMALIERTHAASGADTPDGVIACGCGYYTQSRFVATGFRSPGEVWREATLGALLPSTGSGSTGAQTMVFPVFPAAGPFLNPFQNLLVMFANNLTAGVPLSVTHYGAAMTMLPFAQQLTYSVRGAVVGSQLLLRCA